MGSIRMAQEGISVIVPAYNEVENIEPLCKRLFAALDKEFPKTALPRELLVVDDESAGSEKTAAIVEKLRKEEPRGYTLKGYTLKGRGVGA
jgi:glycosyltransferase involved in cell wall biosynthesis